MITGVHFVEAYGLNPAIYSAHLKLHPLLVLTVLVVAEHSLGVWGLLLAVPLTVFTLDYVLRCAWATRVCEDGAFVRLFWAGPGGAGPWRARQGGGRAECAPAAALLTCIPALPCSPAPARRYPEYSVTGVASKELESVISSMDQPADEALD